MFISISRCPDEGSSRVPIQEIVPTSTVQSHHTSTVIDPHELTTQKNARFIDLAAAKSFEDLRKNFASPEPHLEGSQGFHENSEAHKPTQTLT